MNIRKSSAEWSDSYLDKQPWIKLRKARINEVMIHPKLNQACRLTYFALLAQFDDGYLTENLGTVCAKLNLDTNKVTEHLARLEKAGFLGIENDVYFDNLLAAKKPANSVGFSQILANPKTNVRNSDVCPRENNEIQKQMSGVDKIRDVLSAKPDNTTKTNNTNNSKNNGDPQTPIVFLGQPIGHLTEKDLVFIQTKYLDVDHTRSYQRFVKIHTERGDAEEVTKKDLYGWMKQDQKRIDAKRGVDNLATPTRKTKLYYSPKKKPWEFDEENDDVYIFGKPFDFEQLSKPLEKIPPTDLDGLLPVFTTLLGFELRPKDLQRILDDDNQTILNVLEQGDKWEGPQYSEPTREPESPQEATPAQPEPFSIGGKPELTAEEELMQKLCVLAFEPSTPKYEAAVAKSKLMRLREKKKNQKLLTEAA